MLSSFSSSHHETWDGPIHTTVTFYTAQRGAAITTVHYCAEFVPACKSERQPFRTRTPLVRARY